MWHVFPISNCIFCSLEWSKHFGFKLLVSGNQTSVRVVCLSFVDIMGSSNHYDWLVVDSDGGLGSCTNEEAMRRIFGPGPLDVEPEPQRERDLEDMVDAEIEASAGAPAKRNTQLTLDDVFLGKPKAKKRSSCQIAASGGSGNASSSSRGFDFERSLRGLSTSGTTKTPKSDSNEPATKDNISGSGEAEDPTNSLLVMEEEDMISIFWWLDRVRWSG